MGCRQPALCPSLLVRTGTGFLRNAFPAWRCLHLSCGAPQPPESPRWSGIRGRLCLVGPTRQVAEPPLAPGSLFGSRADSNPSQRLSPAQPPDTIAELEFPEDTTLLFCEHNDLFIHDDIPFPGVREVTMHCGALGIDPVLKAGPHLSLWDLSLRQELISEVMDGCAPEEQASPLLCSVSHTLDTRSQWQFLPSPG